MKKLAAVLILASAGVAMAQQPAPAAPPQGAVAGGVVVAVEQWKGVVLSIDQATRHVVLKGPQGNQHPFTVSKDVPNLDKVKVGDTVSVDFVESVAIVLATSGTTVPSGQSMTTTVTPTGKPAITNVMVTQAQVKVTAVDQANRKLTVVGPHGTVQTFKVDPSVQAFSQVKVGDVIVVRVTDAIAITVTK